MKLAIAPTMLRRFQEHTPPGNPKSIPPHHPASMRAGTVYPRMVRDPRGERVLKSGHNSRKIGGMMTLGPWAGFPIFTLTLEERATCPSTCSEWQSCYGNKMNWAPRFQHGPDLERCVEEDLDWLSRENRRGFVVRPHILGDFYSIDYARKWAGWLDQFPRLHVFGYTARPANSEIGGFVDRMSEARWDRFAVRLSNSERSERSTVTVAHESLAPEGSVVCPAQTEKNKHLACATCGICMYSKKQVAFIRH